MKYLSKKESAPNTQDFSDIKGTGFSMLGRLFGKTLEKTVLPLLRKELAHTPITYSGEEHLDLMEHTPCILIANHVEPESGLALKAGLSLDGLIIEQLLKKRPHQTPSMQAHLLMMSNNRNESQTGLEVRLERKFREAFIRVLGGIPVVKNKQDKESHHIHQEKNILMKGSTLGREIEAVIEQGHSLIIFPEGAWSPEFHEKSPFAEGAAHFAMRYGLPLIPLYIEGGAHTVAAYPIHVEVGKAQWIDEEGNLSINKKDASIKPIPKESRLRATLLLKKTLLQLKNHVKNMSKDN